MFNGVIDKPPNLLNEIVEMIYINAVKYFNSSCKTFNETPNI